MNCNYKTILEVRSMSNVPKFIDTKTIIVNLLKEDEKTCLSIERLQNLLSFIYVELWKRKKLCDYQISFDVNFEAIERTVMYNHEIFALDISGEIIYLRNSQRINTLAQDYILDETISEIIQNFSEVA